MARLISGLVSLIADRAALQVGLGFRHRGIAVFHDHVLLDQERVVAVLDTAINILAERYGMAKVTPLIWRTVIRFLPDRGNRIQMQAGWTGGLVDRAEVVLARGEKWPDNLGRGLLQVLLMELDPQLKVDELFGNELKP